MCTVSSSGLCKWIFRDKMVVLECIQGSDTLRGLCWHQTLRPWHTQLESISRAHSEVCLSQGLFLFFLLVLNYFQAPLWTEETPLNFKMIDCFDASHFLSAPSQRNGVEAPVTTALEAGLASTLRSTFIRSNLSFSEWTKIFHCLEVILNAIFNAVCAQPGYSSHQLKFKHCQ